MSRLAHSNATRERRAEYSDLAELDEGVAHALLIGMGTYTRRYGRVSATALMLADVLVGELRPLPVRR